jgi:hypothetical protein
MAVRVTFDGPRVPVGRRLGRLVGVLAGALLLLVALVGLAVALFVGVLLFVGDQGWSDDETPGAVAVTLVSLGVAAVTLPLALRLLRGRRRLVLFLRRFGFDDASESVASAAVRAVGRSWRVVTLDDSRIRPVGGAPGPRRSLGVVLLLLGAAIAGVVVWFLTSGPDRLVDWAFEETQPDTEPEGFAEAVGAAIGTAIAAALVAGLILMVVLLASVLAGVSSVLSMVSFGKAVGSERTKTAIIRSARDLRTRCDRIDRRSGRIFAPRLVVVRVADEVWQDAVRGFAAHADAVIVDVSEASDNLLWEIRTLLPMFGERCVFIGRHDLLTRPGPGGRTVFNPALGRDLDGRTVLGYDISPRATRRFARGLEGMLEATA